MKHFKLFAQKTFLLFIMVSVLFLNAYAGDQKVVDKTFKPKELVKIKIVSGDCIIKAGNSGEIKVHLVYTYPTDKFEPIFEEDGDTLILKEDFTKKKGNWNVDGKSKWDVVVPASTKIEFSSASGDLDVSDVNGSMTVKVASGDIKAKNLGNGISVKSASGDIDIIDSKGDVAIDSASGDIEISTVSGAFNIKTASGEIVGKGVHCTGESNFKAVSGDVNITMSKSSDFDMNLSTVSGDITLNYNGNPVKGYFTFNGKRDDIHSDISFDSVDSSKYNPFESKYFKKGESPKVFLKTVSGDLRFKK